MNRFCLAAVIGCLAATYAAAKVPGLSGGGSLPLAEVVTLAKPYPNLTLQVRLQLLRANLKRDDVVCAAARYGNQWTALGGRRSAPYECRIGQRKLVITANQIYFDRNGRKVSVSDRELLRKAATVKENGLSWQWK
jgi:hypothetical protein